MISTLLPITQGNPSTVGSSKPPLKNPSRGPTSVVVAGASLVVVVEDTASSEVVVVGIPESDTDEDSEKVLVELSVYSLVEISLAAVEEMNVISDAVVQELLDSLEIGTKPLSLVTVLVGWSPSSLEEDQDSRVVVSETLDSMVAEARELSDEVVQVRSVVSEVDERLVLIEAVLVVTVALND